MAFSPVLAGFLVLALAPAALQEQGPRVPPNLLLSWPPKPSSGLPLAFLLAFPDLELVLAFLDLELVLVFPDLELVLVFLALGQVWVQYLDPWLLLKQPNMEQEGLGALAGLEALVVLVEQVSQVVWQEPDLLPWLLPPRLLPKLANMASGEPVGSELEDWDLEVSQGLGALEVCPQLQLLKQPNMVPLALEAS